MGMAKGFNQNPQSLNNPTRNPQHISSADARTQMRHMLDAIAKGNTDVVIHRHGESVAALIPIEDYEAVKEDLAMARATRVAIQTYNEREANPSIGEPWQDVRDNLLADISVTEEMVEEAKEGLLGT